MIKPLILLAALSLGVAACSERTPPPTPESDRDAAAQSAPAGAAAQRGGDGGPALTTDAQSPREPSDTQGHQSENQAPQQPR